MRKKININTVNVLIILLLLVSDAISTDSLCIINLSSDKDEIKSKWSLKIDSNEIVDIIYPNIELISKGGWVREKEIGDRRPIPDEEGIYDYYYRSVVISSEINYVVVLEKWAGYDEDCGYIKLVNQIYLPIDKMIKIDYNKHLGIYIQSIAWITPTQFKTRINDEEFIFNVKEK